MFVGRGRLTPRADVRRSSRTGTRASTARSTTRSEASAAAGAGVRVDAGRVAPVVAAATPAPASAPAGREVDAVALDPVDRRERVPAHPGPPARRRRSARWRPEAGRRRRTPTCPPQAGAVDGSSFANGILLPPRAVRGGRRDPRKLLAALAVRPGRPRARAASPVAAGEAGHGAGAPERVGGRGT